MQPVFKLTTVGQRVSVCISQVIPFVKRLKHELATIVAPGIRTFQRAVEEKMIKYFNKKMGNIQEDRHKVEQFHFLWNSSTFFRSCDPKVEQLYKKVEQVLKAGHSSTKCGTATHM